MPIMVEFQAPPGKPVLRGHDFFWSVIRLLDERGAWSVHDVLLRTNRTERSTVADFVDRLVAAGIATETGAFVKHQNKSAPTYQLAMSPAKTPSLTREGTPGLQGRGQQQMWNVMRGPMARGGFTFRDLTLYGSTDEVTVAEESAKSYLKRLSEAGYLQCLKEGRPRHPAVWKLKPAMNTGPLPPAVLRTHVVYDQNRGQAFGPLLAEEVMS